MKTIRAGLLAPIVLSGLVAATPAVAQDVTIFTSVPSLGFPFFVHMENELKATAEELGGVEVMSSDGQNSAPKQTADIEAAIVEGVDGMVMAPLDSVAMAPAVGTAVGQGIPVVTVDRRVDGVEVLSHVGADNVAGGVAQAELIKELFPDGARMVNLQGQPGASPAIDRNQGLHDVFDGDDEYVFVAEQTANFAREEGASVTEAILAGLDSPPDVIVAANDDMALGAMQVVQEQGLDIAIIGFDALPEALAAIRDGGLTATIEQMPGEQSATAMRAMVDYLRDGTEPEKLILLEPFAVTQDNLDQAERLGGRSSERGPPGRGSRRAHGRVLWHCRRGERRTCQLRKGAADARRFGRVIGERLEMFGDPGAARPGPGLGPSVDVVPPRGRGCRSVAQAPVRGRGTGGVRRGVGAAGCGARIPRLRGHPEIFHAEVRDVEGVDRGVELGDDRCSHRRADPGSARDSAVRPRAGAWVSHRFARRGPRA